MWAETCASSHTTLNIKRLNSLVFLCILIQTFMGNWLSLFGAYYWTFPVAESTWSLGDSQSRGLLPLIQLHSHHSSLPYSLLNNMTQLLYPINGYNDTPIYPQVEPTRLCVNKTFWETRKGNHRRQFPGNHIRALYVTDDLKGPASVTDYLWQCQNYLQILFSLQIHKQNDQRQITPLKQFLPATEKKQ